MKNKPLIKLSALAAMGLLVVVAFAGLPTTAGNGSCDWAESVTWTLYAGQTIDVGTITAYIDTDGVIHVDYEIIDDWTLTESSVAIVAVDADDCDDCEDYFPTTKAGNPKIGQFPYTSDEFTDHTYEIPMDDEDIAGDDGNGFEYGECLCIATHAVVEKGTGDDYQTQTGWAGDHDFDGNSWAKYFCFKPAKKPIFPTDVKIKMYFTHYGAESYWGVQVFDGVDYDLPYGNLEAMTYVGWCVDKDHTMSTGWHTDFLMDPMTWDNTIEWDKINWILNNRDDYPACDRDEVQNAIWHFTDGLVLTEGSDADDLADDADLYGDGYVVPIGGVYAVVTNTPQKNIIELDP